MKILTTLVARILFGAPFAIFGLFHFMAASKMANMVPLPGGQFWVYVTGVALIAASIAILSKKMGKIAMLLLALMLIIFVVTIHIPSVMGAESQQAMMQSMTNLLKDIALAGGALTYAGIFETEENA